MIILDVNVLLNAYNPRSQAHIHCKEWWELTLSGTETIGLSWITILGFLRISTNPRLAMIHQHYLTQCRGDGNPNIRALGAAASRVPVFCRKRRFARSIGDPLM